RAGELPVGLMDVYNRNLKALTSGKGWEQMTDAERAASALNGFKVAWTGANVTAAVPQVLQLGVPLLHVSSPASIAGNYAVGGASFGPPLSAAGVTGDLALGQDATAPIGNACEPIVTDVAGKIAPADPPPR